MAVVTWPVMSRITSSSTNSFRTESVNCCMQYASAEKLAEAVENLRHAKLQTHKSHFAHKSVLPSSHYAPGKTAKLWQSLSQEQILAKYTRKRT